MQTNFFETIQQLQVKGNLKINIRVKPDDKWLVSVLLVDDNVNDNATKVVPPMNFKGTPKELDEGFFESLEKPLQQTAGLFTNMVEYAAALEESKKQSRMEKETEDRQRREKDDKKKKFDEQMKKVTELEAKEKFGEAIGAMPKAEQYPEYREEIEKKMGLLREKHGTLSLF